MPAKSKIKKKSRTKARKVKVHGEDLVSRLEKKIKDSSASVAIIGMGYVG